MIIEIVAILGISISIIYVWMNVIRVMPYLYANSRIAARSVEDGRRFKSLKDIASHFGVSDSGTQGKAHDSELIENIHFEIEKRFRKEIEEIKNVSPKEAEILFQFFEIKLEAHELKKIYSNLFDHSENQINEVGILKQNLIRRLLEVKNSKDMAVILSDTRYYDFFQERFESIRDFEERLDAFALQELERIARNGDGGLSKIYDKEIIQQFIMLMIEKEKISLEIKGKIKESGNIDDYVQRKHGSFFYEALRKGFEDFKNNNFYHCFEIEMSRLLRKTMHDRSIERNQGTVPILYYLIRREIAKKNYFTISKSLHLERDMEGMII